MGLGDAYEKNQYEAHVRLWGAVIKLAVRDARRVRELSDRPEALKWEQRKYGLLTGRADPNAFLESERFRYICRLAGADPAKVLATIEKELEEDLNADKYTP